MTAKIKYLVLFLMDLVSIPAALAIAFFVRFGVESGIDRMYDFWWAFPIFIIVRIVFLQIGGLYSFLWRYASIKELLEVVKYITFSLLVILVILFAAKKTGFPTSVLAIDYLLNLGLIGGSRLSYRVLRELMRRPDKKADRMRIIIVGAGDSGVDLARQMLKQVDYDLIGFVDDDSTKIGHRVFQLPVFGAIDQLPKVVTEQDIDEVIISTPSATAEEMRRIVLCCENSGATFKTIPSLNEIIDGKVSIAQLREVRIEDLLGREVVDLNLQKISEYLNGERILVTGAGGSIGSEICRMVSQFNPVKLILLGRGENSIYLIDKELRKQYSYMKIVNVIADVKNKKRLEYIFERYRPTVVFHAAAHKHVPLMEANPDEAIINNVYGTQNLVHCAEKYETKKFVMISTDKAVKPSSVMGATKRIAEMVVLAKAGKSKTQFAVVRFGNVLGSRGSVVPLFKDQIRDGGPITVTHPEVTRYFMTIKEAAQLVVQAGSMAEGGEKFILDMGKPIKIVDLARDLIKLSGFDEEDIKIEYTGLRAGEKLHEELFNQNEKTNVTSYKKIFVAEPEEIDERKLDKKLQELINIALENKPDEIRVKIAEIVENYTYK